MRLDIPLGTRVRLWSLDANGFPTGGPVEGIFRGFMTLEDFALYEGEEMTHPGAPRDVDLDGWLDGVGFKPADTSRKQQGHEAARQLVAEFGRLLHGLLPPGRDKSIAFTLLEDVLMRSNRALALGDGPHPDLDGWVLERLTTYGPLEKDPRLVEYEATQRGELADPAAGVPLA